MDYNIEVCDLKDCSKQVISELKKLVLVQSYESRMYCVLTNKDERHEFNLAIAYIDDKIIGWAVLEGSKRDYRYIIGSYIHPKHRRQGIATKLCKILIARKRYVVAIVHNEQAKGFWESVKNSKKYLNIVT